MNINNIQCLFNIRFILVLCIKGACDTKVPWRCLFYGGGLSWHFSFIS